MTINIHTVKESKHYRSLRIKKVPVKHMGTIELDPRDEPAIESQWFKTHFPRVQAGSRLTWQEVEAWCW